MKTDCSNASRSSPCNSRSRRWGIRIGSALGGLLLLSATGCLVIPTPLHRPDRSSRLNVDKHTVEAVKPGEPLADVLLRLGEPDEVSLDGRQLAYRWERTWAYWFVGGGGAAAGGPLTRSRALVIDLDEGNRVRSVAVSADNLVSRPETAQVFTPEHGGKNTSAEAAALRDGSELRQFRGEPLELRVNAGLFTGFDAAELARRSYWQNLGKYPQASVGGELLVTSLALYFKRTGALGTDPPDISVRFRDLTGLECIRSGFSTWLVVRQGTNAPNSFTVFSGGIGSKDKTQQLHAEMQRLWQAARGAK